MISMYNLLLKKLFLFLVPLGAVLSSHAEAICSFSISPASTQSWGAQNYSLHDNSIGTQILRLSFVPDGYSFGEDGYFQVAVGSNRKDIYKDSSLVSSSLVSSGDNKSVHYKIGETGRNYWFDVENINESGVHTVRLGNRHGSETKIVTWQVTANCSKPDNQHSDILVYSLSIEEESMPYKLITEKRYRFFSKISNIGEVDADGSYIRFYLSDDRDINSNDKELDRDDTSPLYPGEINNKRGYFSIYEEGDYFVGACIDSVSNEVNLSNNCTDGIKISVEREQQNSDIKFLTKTCKEVDVDLSNCLGETSEFDYDDTVYAWTKIENITNGNYVAKWDFVNDEKNIIKNASHEFTIDNYSSQYKNVYYLRSNLPPPQQSGSWAVKLTLNDAEVVTKSFIINDKPANPTDNEENDKVIDILVLATDEALKEKGIKKLKTVFKDAAKFWVKNFDGYNINFVNSTKPIIYKSEVEFIRNPISNSKNEIIYVADAPKLMNSLKQETFDYFIASNSGEMKYDLVLLLISELSKISDDGHIVSTRGRSNKPKHSTSVGIVPYFIVSVKDIEFSPRFITYTILHELGHLFGLSHGHPDENAQPFSSGRGFCIKPASGYEGYATIMYYLDYCLGDELDLGKVNSYPLYYSTNAGDLKCNGHACGDDKHNSTEIIKRNIDCMSNLWNRRNLGKWCNE